MVRRFRYRRHHLCRHGWPQRLYPLAGLGQADRRRRAARCLPRTMKCSARAKTDENGRATFTAGLMRGTAALTPGRHHRARNGDVRLRLPRYDARRLRPLRPRRRPAAARRVQSTFMTWTERGIYRAGETVHASALARDTDGNAIDNLPLTFIFLRPDGVEDRRDRASRPANIGGYAFDFDDSGKCHARHLDDERPYRSEELSDRRRRASSSTILCRIVPIWSSRPRPRSSALRHRQRSTSAENISTARRPPA